MGANATLIQHAYDAFVVANGKIRSMPRIRERRRLSPQPDFSARSVHEAFVALPVGRGAA